MQSIVSQLEAAFRLAILEAVGFEAEPLMAVSQNEKFGDYQSNAPMGLARLMAERTGQKTNPRAIAEQIKGKLKLGEMASEVSIAGPGFINVRLDAGWLGKQLAAVAGDGRLGIDATAKPITTVVDYSGPNVAKQMHVGHLRSTIIGDAIARVLAFEGDDVIRQNHIGDWGTQFGKVVLAMWYVAMFEHAGQSDVLKSEIEALGAAMVAKDAAGRAAVVARVAEAHRRFLVEDPKGSLFEAYLQNLKLDLAALESVYQFVGALVETPEAAAEVIDGEKHALADVPRLTTTFIQNPQEERNQQEKLAWLRAREVTLVTCAEIYRRLNVQLADAAIQKEPLERGESFYNPFLSDVVVALEKKDIAAASLGAIVVETPGYENPLIIRKQDGGYLYATTDLAAIRFRVEKLHAKRIIYTHDSRQAQHFAQVFETARRAGWANDVVLEYAPFGTMLGEDGKPFKTRSGGTVKLKDLLDEAIKRAGELVDGKNPNLPAEQRQAIAEAVGIGAVKYSDLSKDRVSDYKFAWDQILSMDGNTGPYLQYAYARIKSIFRKAGAECGGGAVKLESPFELALAKHVLRFGEVIELVGRELKPHHLCTYLYELAAKFSGFYENCPVLQSEEPTRSSRLALCSVTANTIALGLDLLGIEHPEQM